MTGPRRRGCALAAVLALSPAASSGEPTQAEKAAVSEVGALRRGGRLKSIRQRLGSKEDRVRYLTAYALADIPAPEFADEMASLLKDPSPDVRIEAAYFMGAVHACGRIDDLNDLVSDGDPRVRKAAIKALARITAPGAPPCPPKGGTGCDGTVGSTQGLLVDAREFAVPDAGFTPDDIKIVRLAARAGPFFVLVEDGSRRVRPFYLRTAEGAPETMLEMAERLEPFDGRRILAKGCLSSGGWPAVLADAMEPLP